MLNLTLPNSPRHVSLVVNERVPSVSPHLENFPVFTERASPDHPPNFKCRIHWRSTSSSSFHIISQILSVYKSLFFRLLWKFYFFCYLVSSLINPLSFDTFMLGLEGFDFKELRTMISSLRPILKSQFFYLVPITLESTILIPSQLFYNTFPPFSAVLKELPLRVLDL